MFNQNLAIIIGGSSGMGLETAKKLSSNNMELLITGKDKKNLKMLRQKYKNWEQK